MTESESEESERFHFFRFRLLGDSAAYDPVKTRLSETGAEGGEPANRKARSRTLSLVYSSASACDSDNAVFTDRKRRSHKQNQCSASDSVGLILVCWQPVFFSKGH